MDPITIVVLIACGLLLAYRVLGPTHGAHRHICPECCGSGKEVLYEAPDEAGSTQVRYQKCACCGGSGRV